MLNKEKKPLQKRFLEYFDEFIQLPFLSQTDFLLAANGY